MPIDPPTPQNLNDWAKDFDQIAVDIAKAYPDQATRLKIYAQGSRNWASIGPYIVAPPVDPPPDDPNDRIVNIRKSQDANGARLDFDTTQQVATYGHDTWTSGAQDAARRTFDLTFLSFDADISVKVTFADGKVAPVVIHTNPKVQ